MPKSVKVGVFEYSISTMPKAEAEAKGVFGEAVHTLRSIRLEEGLEGVELAVTLLHEVLHAVRSERGLPGGEEEERVIGSLAAGLAAVIVDNEKLALWLVETLQGE